MRAQRGLLFVAIPPDVNAVVCAGFIRRVFEPAEFRDSDCGGPDDPRDRVGRAFVRIPAGVRGGGDSVRGEATHRDVIGVLVAPIRIKRQDYFRTQPSKHPNHRTAYLVHWRLRQLLVLKGEEFEFVDAEYARGVPQFRLPYARQFFDRAEIAGGAPLATSSAQEADSHTLCDTLRDCASRQEALVIRVREQEHERAAHRTFTRGRSATETMP